MSLSELFAWEAKDEIGLYPFEARCLAADFPPDKFSELMELGKPSLDFIFGKTARVSRQIRGGEITLYFPERWLSVKQKVALMQSICDVHDIYPLRKVNVITGEPIIISDFTHEMVRLWRDEG